MTRPIAPDPATRLIDDDGADLRTYAPGKAELLCVQCSPDGSPGPCSTAGHRRERFVTYGPGSRPGGLDIFTSRGIAPPWTAGVARERGYVYHPGGKAGAQLVAD